MTTPREALRTFLSSKHNSQISEDTKECSMADQTYRGNCHCGDYRFELTVPPIHAATACTCLACKKGGYLWLVPSADSFREVRNVGKLIEYESPALIHKFCAKCVSPVTGEHTSGPMKGQFAVNVRVIQGVNPFKLEINTVAVEHEKRVLQPLPAAQPQAQHTSSCICGKVRTELLVPVTETEIKEDNCSTCVRTAYVGTYPTRDQVRIHGKEHCTYYIRPPYNGGSALCGTCGQLMFGKVNGPPASVFFNVPQERLPTVLDRYASLMNLQPLNIRSFDDVEISDLKYQPADDGTDGYVLDPEWET